MKNGSIKTNGHLSRKLKVTEILKYILWITVFTSLILVNVHLKIRTDRIMAETKNLQDKKLRLAEENKKLEIEMENLKHPSRILNLAMADLGMVRDDQNEKLIISNKNFIFYKESELDRVREIREKRGIKEFLLALLNITESAKAENK